MRDKAQRRIRHVAKMKTGGVIRSEKLGQTMRVSGSSSERILADKNNNSMYKSINIEGQQLYVKLSTKKD